MVTFIPSSIWRNLGDKLLPFVYPNSKTNYPGIDAYLIQHIKAKDKNRHLYESDLAYWHHLFGTSRRNRNGEKMSKGFLEIIY
jgi:hypothetical protein